MVLAAVKANYVVLVPVDGSQVPNGCLYLDQNNGDAATIKGTGGGNSPVTSSSSDFFTKQMIAGGAIAANRPISKRSDGKVIDADSDGVDAQNFIGYSLQSAAGDGSPLNTLLAGPNLAGALVGLGFMTGEVIYLSESGGYTNDINSFTGANDTIVRVGVADCAASVASGTAVDLIGFTNVLISP